MFMSPALSEISQPNAQKGVFTGSSVVSETTDTFPIYYCIFYLIYYFLLIFNKDEI